jgi:hypothetical protein
VAAWPAVALVGSDELLMTVIRSSQATPDGASDVARYSGPASRAGGRGIRRNLAADRVPSSARSALRSASASLGRSYCVTPSLLELGVLAHQSATSGSRQNWSFCMWVFTPTEPMSTRTKSAFGVPRTIRAQLQSAISLCPERRGAAGASPLCPDPRRHEDQDNQERAGDHEGAERELSLPRGAP